MTDTDSRVAYALAALYLALCAVLLPPAEYPRALGGGVAAFAAVLWMARAFGRGRIYGLGLLAVGVVSALVLVIPTFPAMGGTRLVAVPLGFLGMQATMLLWAARRWTPRAPAREHTPLRQAMEFAMFAGAGLSVFATIPIVLALRDGARGAATMLLVYPGYFAGTMSAAIVYWLLQRLAHLAVGRYLIGVLGGICLYGAMAPIVWLSKGEPFDPGLMLFLASIPGGFVGPAVALEFDEL